MEYDILTKNGSLGAIAPEAFEKMVFIPYDHNLY
jgi:hypothetical protein